MIFAPKSRRRALRYEYRLDVVNIGLGVVTPPFAMSIFVGSRLSGCSYTELVPIMMKFLFLIGIPTLLLTTYIPALSCWLPTVLLGQQIVGAW